MWYVYHYVFYRYLVVFMKIALIKLWLPIWQPKQCVLLYTDQLQEFDTMWFTIRTGHVPRAFPHIYQGIIYHPPKAKKWPIIRHTIIMHSIDYTREHHTHAGIIITGDLNKLPHSHLNSQFNLRQIVKQHAHGNNILGKVLTDMDILVVWWGLNSTNRADQC